MTSTTSSGTSPAAVGGFADVKYPTVHWKQTTSDIVFTVDLPDIQSYDLVVKRRNVSFRTTVPSGYGFDFELFGAVAQQPVVHLTGQEMKLKLSKRVQ